MQNVEQFFNDTVANYNIFKKAAVNLLEEVPTLSPEEIRRRCEKLGNIYKELHDKKEQLFAVIDFFGPGLLDTTYISEFQQALDQSIVSCDALYEEILAYRDNLDKPSANKPATTPNPTTTPAETT